MKTLALNLSLPLGLMLLAASTPRVAHAQFVPLPPAQTTPMAQRNAMNLVQNQMRWFQNACGTASSYVGGGAPLLQQQFQAVCGQYANFKSTLTPQQLNSGANMVAELDAGLEIIQEAFGDYDTAIANGQSPASAYSNLRQVLSQAMRVWSDQFRRDCGQIRVGW